MVEFVGPGLPLTQRGVDAATTSLGVEPAALWAVLAVETSGCGFLSDRRPKILFERHVFSRLTAHRYDADDPDVSQPTAGGYGPGGAYQYGRLMAAIQLDRAAALQSASWGLGQIMGENHDACRFAGVEEMAAAMVASEDQQLAAMAAYLRAAQMAELLQRQDWSGFARRYNGPNYAAHNYDGLLQQFHARYSAGPLPDLRV
ncbi:MAG TPA: N-acetylmuramidase family protein, partial [Stellaceae bacterium]|nr:N-acetylmuramidase family protein [Stellaceae bacterium]